ncbi:hypothetical protein GCM10027085_05550 [Spirosoma aerophilum]
MFNQCTDPASTDRKPRAGYQYIGTTVSLPADLIDMVWIDGGTFTQSNEAGKGAYAFFERGCIDLW